MHHFGTWGGGWMMIFWIALIIAAIALLFLILSKQKQPKNDKTPIEILKERYAEGKIDDEEFERRKKKLSS
ncbi:MAG: hypothetical protein GVY08_04640 [Bacteroidetes bacterium]|jgi:putative membrane protein|nr:hypothetical protein [Bacteroidota bacterium]